MMKTNHFLYRLFSVLSVAIAVFSMTACSSDSDNGQLLRDDIIKRTVGPNVAGNKIYFVYAMAVPYGTGKIQSCTVEASITGAEGTMLENNSYHSDASGFDVPVKIGDPCVNEGNKTTVTFTTDTCAAALRYYYVIPNEAKGKDVSFVFTAKSADGETVSRKMGPYHISNMDIKRDIQLTKTRCYISIENMAAYTLAEADTIKDKIDLVYLWRNKTSEGVNFGHVFAAPAADPEWLDNIKIPDGMNNEVKIRKGELNIDTHLTDEPAYGTYIDEVDLQTIDLNGFPDYAVNMKAGYGMWVETADGKYKAYIHINSLRNISGGVISIKRLRMK